MNDITIRPVLETEISKLHELVVSTFIATFSPDNTAENMHLYVQKALGIKTVRSEFAAKYSSFYFACYNGKIAGYLKLNTDASQTERLLENALEIERIYVLEQYQGLKIGKSLFQKALQICTTNKYNWLWLGVWDQNKKAIKFYEMNGFKIFDAHDFTLGTAQQIDYLMKLQITAQTASTL